MRLGIKQTSIYMQTFVLALTSALLFASCVPQGSSGARSSKSSNSSTTTTTAIPTTTPLAQSSNFLQRGTVQYSGTMLVEKDFSDSFMIRGNAINTYLNNTAYTNTVLCLVAHYTYSSDNKLLVLAAIPQYITTSSTGAREYLYRIDGGDSAVNKANCQKSGLLTALDSVYTGQSVAYNFAGICTNCSTSLTSDGLKLYSTGGVAISALTVSNLLIQISGNTTNVNIGGTCSTSSDCTSQGYDCCLSNQCVVNGATIAGVDTTSSEFQSAMSAIQSNASVYTNYPHFFYVCPIVSSTPTPTATTTIDPVTAAADRLARLGELYDCTTQGSDEMSFCTTRIEHADATITLGGGAGVFSAAIDDKNFRSINAALPTHTIVSVIYAGRTLYKANPDNLSQNITALSATDGVFGAGNDDVTSGQNMTITASLPSTPPDHTLKIRYKIDGSCERVNAALIRCTKYYVQGQGVAGNPRVSDHLLSSSVFALPSYIDTNYQIVVKLDGVTLAASNCTAPYATTCTWHRAGNSIVFERTVSQDQKVTISYYVSGVEANTIMTSKEAAQTEIKNYCKGEDLRTTLSPIVTTIGGVETITDYGCVYPSSTTTIPLQQTVTVSSKAVPLRYFDVNGVPRDDGITSSTPAQEGTAFSYIDSNMLKPNNQSMAVGFNEITGSLGTLTSNAAPAKMVPVKKNTTYDIAANSSSFTPCTTCGNDYWSSLQKIFPQSFLQIGGGYIPDKVETSRLNNATVYRADDLLFGRACFVPPTMIPWTHVVNATSATTQRRNRMAAQHFLFANGYQRDWYGFDYGALIGSFDGVTWFSVGNGRRITAKSGRLYLAINAFYGDLTTQSSYSVNVTEVATVLASDSISESDVENSGAECQKIHFCSTDQDCATKLGWDYSCQDVSGIKTPWPKFDENGYELVNDGGTPVSISSLIGGLNGQTKRCVYRGRGAPCYPNPSTTSDLASKSYASTSVLGHHMCSSNNYCASTSTSVFNDRIARFGKSPANQNASTVVTVGASDTIGISARVLGRPMNFNGTVSGSSVTNLNSTTHTQFLCVPGRDTAAATTVTLDSAAQLASSTRNGDRLLGIGVTVPLTSSSTTSSTLHSFCPTFDSQGNNLSVTSPASTLGSASVQAKAASQNMSTQLIATLNAETTPADNLLQLWAKKTSDTIMTQKGIQENACLRAPGASCFSDMECAPSEYIANRMLALSKDDVTYSEAELKFWQEGLVCATKLNKANPDYDLTQNHCCRESGKTLSIYSDQTFGTVTAGHLYTKETEIAGVHQPINNIYRYSRIAPAYDKMQSDSTSYPALRTWIKLLTSGAATATDMNPKQFNTLHEIASKTCCSTNWVRNFNAEENIGGHLWTASRAQSIDKAGLNCLNWTDKNAGTAQATKFTCTASEADSNKCKARNLTSAQQSNYLGFFGTLELLGVPQIKVKSTTGGFTASESVACMVDPSTQLANTTNIPIPGTINASGIVEYTSASGSYYSADDVKNFDNPNTTGTTNKLKRVFSANEFSCCLPTGENHGTTLTDEMCCTGRKNPEHSGYCCLEDYTDVSVYLNRFISSEGAGLSSSSYDPVTGYIKDKNVVYQLANTKAMCCSGKVAFGRAISKLTIPGAPNLTSNSASGADVYKTYRFTTQNTTSDDPEDQGYPATVYDAGVRWNDHLYCVPSDGFPEITQ